MIKIITTGGRNFRDEAVIKSVMFRLMCAACFDSLVVVHGDCPTGADHGVDFWCTKTHTECHRYPADWATHGRAAGPLRNAKMISQNLDADLVVAFPGGRGTADTVKRARAAGLFIFYVLPAGDFVVERGKKQSVIYRRMFVG